MLAAIEGTGESWVFRGDYSAQNGFVWQFCMNYSGRGNIHYFAGPTVSGNDCADIAVEVCRFIEGELRAGDEEINLVGYSRGGFIAMSVARYLGIRKRTVNFLGLFDAVRMTVMIGPYETNTIPENIRYCYHAFRNPQVGSHPGWSNTAYEHEQGIWEFQKEMFMASHSGMGGWPGAGDVTNNASEQSESARAGSWMSQYAMKHGLLTKRLVPVKFKP